MLRFGFAGAAMVRVELINLFFAGILAGLEVSIHYGLRAPATALDEKAQIVLRQGLVRRLRWLVPAFFLPAALSGIVVAITDGATPGLHFRIAGLFAIVVWVFVRVVGTVRINAATLDWSPDAPPVDWREQIRKAERFHIAGTWAAILAFVFFLASMAQRLG
jgi:hypothetical protein